MDLNVVTTTLRFANQVLLLIGVLAAVGAAGLTLAALAVRRGWARGAGEEPAPRLRVVSAD